MKNLSELRIGNFVHANNEIRKINGVIRYGLYFDYGYCPNQKDWIKPIELDGDWLKKLGFDPKIIKMSGCNVWQNGRYRILKSYVEPEKEFALCIEGITPATWVLARFSHVHRLQNVYFELENEELTIKEN